MVHPVSVSNITTDAARNNTMQAKTCGDLSMMNLHDRRRGRRISSLCCNWSRVLLSAQCSQNRRAALWHLREKGGRKRQKTYLSWYLREIFQDLLWQQHQSMITRRKILPARQNLELLLHAVATLPYPCQYKMETGAALRLHDRERQISWRCPEASANIAQSED